MIVVLLSGQTEGDQTRRRRFLIIAYVAVWICLIITIIVIQYKIRTRKRCIGGWQIVISRNCWKKSWAVVVVVL